MKKQPNRQLRYNIYTLVNIYMKATNFQPMLQGFTYSEDLPEKRVLAEVDRHWFNRYKY
jgi:hypothetical protein